MAARRSYRLCKQRRGNNGPYVVHRHLGDRNLDSETIRTYRKIGGWFPILSFETGRERKLDELFRPVLH